MEAARALLTGCRLQLGQRSFISVPLPSHSGQPRISLPSHPDSVWPGSGAPPEVGPWVGGGWGGLDRAGLPGDHWQGRLWTRWWSFPGPTSSGPLHVSLGPAWRGWAPLRSSAWKPPATAVGPARDYLGVLVTSEGLA